MAGERILVIGTPTTLEANGASTANNVVTQANDSAYSVVTHGANFMDAKFVFSGAFSVAPTENSSILLLARPINIDGTNDSEAPESTRGTYSVGAFVLNNVTTTQYMELIAYDVPWEAEYSILNNATGQTLSAGWTLKVTPFSSKAA